jgi:preprotein translocase SecE subunit
MEEKKESVLERFKRFLNDVALEIKRFLNDVALEMKRSTWPDRKTLISHTIIVVVSVFMLGLFVGINDKVIAALLKLLP